MGDSHIPHNMTIVPTPGVVGACPLPSSVGVCPHVVRVRADTDVRETERMFTIRCADLYRIHAILPES